MSEKTILILVLAIGVFMFMNKDAPKKETTNKPVDTGGKPAGSQGGANGNLLTEIVDLLRAGKPYAEAIAASAVDKNA